MVAAVSPGWDQTSDGVLIFKTNGDLGRENSISLQSAETVSTVLMVQ